VRLLHWTGDSCSVFYMMDGLPHSNLNRRSLLKAAAVGCAGVAAPGLLRSAAGYASDSSPLVPLMDGLLRDWCDGLVRLQFRDVSRPETCGAFQCPGCGFIHGRCGDAVYPLLHIAKKTGRSEYLDAGIAAFEWTRNVDAPDGAWTNDLDPKSWKGTTVFGSIAAAEAIGRHGDLLDGRVKDRWMARLKRAADYIHTTFDMETGNINYGLTATYALALLGHLFDEPRYIRRSHELAGEAQRYLTEPNRLIFGEGRPTCQKTAKGCLAVDLGYNVEESLPALVMYGLLEKDEDMLRLATRSLAAHLEFMLPDGAWDNSWGTRSYKWTYWGSRTSDGSSPAYSLLAGRHPGFGAAALRNTRLLRACTHDGTPSCLGRGGEGHPHLWQTIRGEQARRYGCDRVQRATAHP
jgi:hypothetical protein